MTEAEKRRALELLDKTHNYAFLSGFSFCDPARRYGYKKASDDCYAALRKIIEEAD